MSSNTQIQNSGLNEPLLRGDIYWADLNPTIGRETGKRRPVLIIQNNTGNKFSPVTIIAPITSVKEIPKQLPVMVLLEKGEGNIEEDSFIDCGQIRTLDKNKRLTNKIGCLSVSKLYEVNKALK